jgi:hypothetical protein
MGWLRSRRDAGNPDLPTDEEAIEQMEARADRIVAKADKFLAS